MFAFADAWAPAFFRTDRRGGILPVPGGVRSELHVREERADGPLEVGEASLVADDPSGPGSLLGEGHLVRLAPGHVARSPAAGAHGALFALGLRRFHEHDLVALRGETVARVVLEEEGDV